MIEHAILFDFIRKTESTQFKIYQN